MNFVLDERLAADTLALRKLELCDCRIMNDSRYPWCVLIPRQPELRELHELTQSQRQILMEEVQQVSLAIEQELGVTKINVGALGNLVPQLHIHVVGRCPEDPAWPGPVWGFGKAQPYASEQLTELLGRLRTRLA